MKETIAYFKGAAADLRKAIEDHEGIPMTYNLEVKCTCNEKDC